ncbi:hypothetical protein D3C81_1498060 [compost metagenome]
MRQFVRILNIHQVNIGQFIDRFTDVIVRKGNFIYPFKLRHLTEAVVCGGTRSAGLVRRAFVIIALDHQAMSGVDHIKIADGVLVVLQHVLPTAPGPGLLFHVKFQHPQVAFAIDVLEFFTVPQRTFQQRVQFAAVR